MTDSTTYRRSPLPAGAHTPLGWFGLLWLCLIASPFLGFAVAGKVGVPGLNLGLGFAAVPLGLFAVLAVRRWIAWRKLPPEVAQEWRTGRLVSPQNAPKVHAPVVFANKKDRLEVTTSGVLIARRSVLSMQAVGDAMQQAWVLEQTGQIFVAWADVAEWVVDTDSDGPDYYRLELNSGGRVRVRRFLAEPTLECHLLDAVRSVGSRPVRLFCDVS
jgi:hypothetical protein